MQSTRVEAESTRVAALGDYLKVVRRRKWIILGVLVVVPALAAILSLRQGKLYQASSEVLINQQNLAASLTGTPNANQGGQQADRTAQTQADLAQVPIVARRALAAAHVTTMTARELLDSSTVSLRPNADLLEFSVQNRDPALAKRLASAYAKAFTAYRRQLDTRALIAAAAGVASRVAALKASGDSRSPLYNSLLEKEQELRTMEALETSNAFVVRSAERAVKVQPRPVRNILLALMLALVLGLAAAFARDALDTQVRSADEISERLRLPILARLPRGGGSSFRRRQELVMLADPRGPAAESVRVLRTTLEFANLDRGAHIIMVTSAIDSEGKSTTVANLAVALARVGKRVALVDLDLRQPSLERLFDVGAHEGLTEVVLGRVELEDALIRVDIEGSDIAPPETNGNGHDRAPGVLDLMTAGSPPSSGGEFVASPAITTLLWDLRERYDWVLVDAPPLLRVGDAITLMSPIDAFILVARPSMLRTPVVKELERVLSTVPTVGLGIVETDAPSAGLYTYKSRYTDEPARKKRAERIKG